MPRNAVAAKKNSNVNHQSYANLPAFYQYKYTRCCKLYDKNAFEPKGLYALTFRRLWQLQNRASIWKLRPIEWKKAEIYDLQMMFLKYERNGPGVNIILESEKPWICLVKLVTMIKN